jgi:hypothetical protein
MPRESLRGSGQVRRTGAGAGAWPQPGGGKHGLRVLDNAD